MFEFARVVFDREILRHVHFAADDRLYVVFFAKFGKIQRRVHVPVVCDRERLDSVFDAMVNKVVHLAGPVEQAVFGMKV